MSDREIDEKFLKQTEPLVGKQKSRVLLDQLWDLENLKDVTVPLASMAVPNH